MPTFEDLLGNVARLDEGFAAMQVTGKVDKEIDDTLEQIISFVTRREQFWFQGEPNRRTFTVYHSWRNLRLVFSKMRNRFANAQLVHDNPVVVDQAREIIPKVLSTLASLIAMEKEPTDSEIEPILEHVRELRASARQVDMVQPLSEELKETDQAKLTAALDELLKRMATLGEA